MDVEDFGFAIWYAGGDEVSVEDQQANDEDKRWEWSRDAYSWSARDAMDLELSDCPHQGEDQ